MLETISHGYSSVRASWVPGFGVALLGLADPDIFSEKAHESTVAGMFRFNRNITTVGQNKAEKLSRTELRSAFARNQVTKPRPTLQTNDGPDPQSRAGASFYHPMATLVQ